MAEPRCKAKSPPRAGFSVSHKHLHRYLSEFEFRHNHRELSDGERTLRAIRAANHKRLKYKEVTR